MERRPRRKVNISVPKDRSLEAYRAWVLEISKRLMSTELVMSEKEWVNSWKQYWEGEPSKKEHPRTSAGRND